MALSRSEGKQAVHSFDSCYKLLIAKFGYFSWCRFWSWGVFFYQFGESRIFLYQNKTLSPDEVLTIFSDKTSTFGDKLLF